MGCQAGISALKKEQNKMREGTDWRWEGIFALMRSGISSWGWGIGRMEGLQEEVQDSKSSGKDGGAEIE